MTSKKTSCQTHGKCAFRQINNKYESKKTTVVHLGIAKMIARLARKYYWPGMFRDTAKFIRECQSCQKYKPSQLQTPGQMQSTNIPQEPWQTVSSDVIGPQPTSTKGNNYLIVFQDTFTKWVEMSPIRKITANVVTQQFKDKILMKFGCPNRQRQIIRK